MIISVYWKIIKTPNENRRGSNKITKKYFFTVLCLYKLSLYKREQKNTKLSTLRAVLTWGNTKLRQERDGRLSCKTWVGESRASLNSFKANTFLLFTRSKMLQLLQILTSYLWIIRKALMPIIKSLAFKVWPQFICICIHGRAIIDNRLNGRIKINDQVIV